MSARELVERAALWSWPPAKWRRAREAEPTAPDRPEPQVEGQPPPLYFSEPRRRAETPDAADEWNLWELERRARAYAGAEGLPQEWAAIFRHLREFANSDGRLPARFDSLVRESFPELTRVQ